jgi:hypothetical protein
MILVSTKTSFIDQCRMALGGPKELVMLPITIMKVSWSLEPAGQTDKKFTSPVKSGDLRRS